jgi:vitamin B12 transporter
LGAERVDERESLTTIATSNFGTGSFTEATEFEGDRGNTAGYAQLLAAPGSRLDLQSGLRFDHNEVFGDFTTWQGGIVFRPATSLRLFGSAGTGFRQPTFSEQFARTAFEVGNPDLVPERSTSWEAGAEVSMLSNRLTLTASYFAQSFRDLIQFRAAEPEQPTYANIARARADGIETGARFWLGHGVALSADYTWLDTEVEDDGGLGTTTYQVGEALLRRPPHSLGIGLGWRTSDHGWYNLRLQYTGDRDDVDFREFPAERVTLEGYTLLDATAEVPLSLMLGASAAPFRVALWGQNLLDSDYESVVGFAGRGRTLLVGISLRK